MAARVVAIGAGAGPMVFMTWHEAQACAFSLAFVVGRRTVVYKDAGAWQVSWA